MCMRKNNFCSQKGFIRKICNLLLQISCLLKTVMKLNIFDILQRVVYWLLLLNIFVFLFVSFFNIFEYKEGLTFGIFYILLYIISLVSTYTVLSSFNYIVSIVYLIFLFSLTGLILMFCGVNFVGLTLIAVYVGGVLLLFLSVIKFLGFRAGDSMYVSDLYSGLFKGILEISKFLFFLVALFILVYFCLKVSPSFLNIVLSK